MQYWERIDCSERGISPKQGRRCPGRNQRVLQINVVWTQSLSCFGWGLPRELTCVSSLQLLGVEGNTAQCHDGGLLWLPPSRAEWNAEWAERQKSQRAFCSSLPSFSRPRFSTALVPVGQGLLPGLSNGFLYHLVCWFLGWEHVHVVADVLCLCFHQCWKWVEKWLALHLCLFARQVASPGLL